MSQVLHRIKAAGITLQPLPGGKFLARPRTALTDELRDLIRQHKAELLQALSGPLSDLAAESRRRRVLNILGSDLRRKYAVVTDEKADTDDVIVAFAIRGRATCELHIPRDKWDGVLFLDLVEHYGSTEH